MTAPSSQVIFDAVAFDLEHWSIARSRGVVTLTHHGNVQGACRHRGIREIVQVRLRPAPSHHHHQPTVPHPYTPQVILREYASPSEVLLGFDVDCCCCGYDGMDVWALPRCIRALRHGTNILNPLHACKNHPHRTA
jgi:hypothetical protein